jgi:enamine deaminase RidA (YjgF/YER057c/UK114 family)
MPMIAGFPDWNWTITATSNHLISKRKYAAFLQNVKAILEASGSSWEQLVDVTVFLVDMKRDFHTFNRLYAEYFKDNQPCRTTMEINSLPTPIAIELKCIATVE